MLQEKQFFLSCLEKGPESLRRISNRMSTRFSISPAAVKNALLKEGLIELDCVRREGETQRLNHYFRLTDKKLEVTQEVEQQEPENQVSEWEDGTPKSKGNAFDWASKKCTLFSKMELAQMTQKYHNNQPITIYSRA
jgi:hypothetical protein